MPARIKLALIYRINGKVSLLSCLYSLRKEELRAIIALNIVTVDQLKTCIITIYRKL